MHRPQEPREKWKLIARLIGQRVNSHQPGALGKVI